MNIGLIAMSGLRLCDPELARIGLTLPGFLERGRAIASLPSLGLLTLAAMVPPPHRATYLEVRDLGQQAARDDFDLVAISSYSAQIFEAYELADRYRAAGVTVVLGGLHVTALPPEAAQHADAVVIGEGEAVWPQLLRDFERGELKSSYGSIEQQFDLRQTPLPAFELLDRDKYDRITVQASRGCPHRCEFCASSVLLCPEYKQKPRERVLAEVDKVLDLWPRPFIEFADDNALVNRRYWTPLLRELSKRHLRWFAETDVTVAEDDDFLTLMRDAGCVEVLIGLESPVIAGLDGLERNNNWKFERFSRYATAVGQIQSHGIRVNGCFVLGLDGHTPDVFEAVMNFARQTELFDVQITILTPFPGTPLYQRLKSERRLTHDGEWNRCTLFDVNFKPRGMSAAQLESGFHDLAVRLYSEEFTEFRRHGFHRQARHRAVHA